MNEHSLVPLSAPISKDMKNAQSLNQLLVKVGVGKSLEADIIKASGADVSLASQVLDELVSQGILRRSVKNPQKLTFSDNSQLLSSSRIHTLLSARAQRLIKSLDVRRVIGSTNDQLLETHLSTGEAAACIAEMQVSGRGRRGNVWQSGAFRNITMSLAQKLPEWPDSAPSFALAAAVTVATVLNAHYSIDVRIKWPNDLLVNRAKLGGLLIEAAGAYDGECTLVVGLGLNVLQDDQSKAVGSDYAWTSLHALGAEVDRNELVAQLLNNLLDCIGLFEEQGFAPFVTHWQVLSAYQDMAVTVEGPNVSYRGWQRGVNHKGALLVETASGEMHTVDDMACSVRALEDEDE